jgi:hypothetical protein
MTPTFEGPVAYYAFGGGLGHLTRARAMRATLDLPEFCATFSSSGLACDPDLVSGLNPCLAPAKLQEDVAGFRAWLGEHLERLAPRWLFIDAFPAGILGELCGFSFPPGMRLAHVARILRWQSYQQLLLGPLPFYDRVFVVERIADDHRAWLESLSGRIEDLDLRDVASRAPVAASVAAIAERWKERQKPVWLVVHAGVEGEIRELLDYAREYATRQGQRPAFVVVSPSPPAHLQPDETWLRFHPANALFPLADKIVTAGGFNSVRQARPWRSRHLALPLPRRFDDQFLRCRWLREEG